MSDPRKGTAGLEPGRALPTAGEPVSPSRAGTYAGVVAVEVLVIAALWFFSRYFSA